jgi:hypothetical protein
MSEDPLKFPAVAADKPVENQYRLQEAVVTKTMHLLVGRNRMESAAKPTTTSHFFDSQAQTFARTRGAAHPRHLVLRAEGFDVHAKIRGESPGKQMTGQILARGAAVPSGGARLHLLRDGERLAIALADKFGEFRFNDVPEGHLSLQIDLPHLTVVGSLNLDAG